PVLVDPAVLSERERRERRIHRYPTTLGEALDRLEGGGGRLGGPGGRGRPGAGARASVSGREAVGSRGVRPRGRGLRDEAPFLEVLSWTSGLFRSWTSIATHCCVTAPSPTPPRTPGSSPRAAIRPCTRTTPPRPSSTGGPSGSSPRSSAARRRPRPCWPHAR